MSVDVKTFGVTRCTGNLLDHGARAVPGATFPVQAGGRTASRPARGSD
jgi:hypothetical protein